MKISEMNVNDLSIYSDIPLTIPALLEHLKLNWLRRVKFHRYPMKPLNDVVFTTHSSYSGSIVTIVVSCFCDSTGVRQVPTTWLCYLTNTTFHAPYGYHRNIYLTLKLRFVSRWTTTYSTYIHMCSLLEMFVWTLMQVKDQQKEQNISRWRLNQTLAHSVSTTTLALQLKTKHKIGKF